MMGLLMPRYCVECGEFEVRPLQGHCLLCAMRWPDLRGGQGTALLRSRLEIPWGCTGFRVSDSPALRRRLYGLKYGGEKSWGREAGRWLAEGNAWPFATSADVRLVPIPLHWRRKWTRGYNQAEAIARGLADVWQVPVDTQALKRSRHKVSLTASGRAGRQNALRDTYSAAEASAGMQFVIVDDVITTGSTCRAAATVLEEAGAHWNGLVVWGLA